LYDWNGSSWVQVGQDIDGEAADDESGFSVSLSSDGRRVAIGATGNDGNGNASGQVRIYNTAGGTFMDEVEVFAAPTVTFSAPADLCIDAGVQTGLGGGSPTGGLYSGTGVTDDGNGMTYSFDPAAAGVGTQTITYDFTDTNSCSASASDDVEVFALPVVTFTAPADICIDAGVQSGLDGGTPTGGVYSGPGVTNDGNGMTYSFDPAAAGVGTHTITYDFTDANSCSASASDDVEVFALPVVTFTALADLCVDASVQAGLGGGTPTGGVYSGPGVTDDGNGMTYSFDPAAAGVGTHTITYDFTDANSCSASASDDVEVFALPVVTFTALADLCVDASVQAGLGGGTPTGGVYSGPGVTDDGNGMTYSFDPAAAGVGTHTITYDFTDANSCSASASDDVEVTAGGDCSTSLPVELTSFTGRTAGKQNILEWTVASEEAFSYYELERSPGDAANWEFLGAVAGAGQVGQAQAYTYTDVTPPNSAYYRLRMVNLDGSFAYSNIVYLEQATSAGELVVYPNPNNGQFTVQLPTDESATLTLYDLNGRTVWQRKATSEVSIVSLPDGVYLLSATTASNRWTKRIVVW
jgi:hypothetical protein